MQKQTVTAFYERTKQLPPSPLLVQALDCGIRGNKALDLGCGAGRDTRFLLHHGFHVTAVDHNPEAWSYFQDVPQDHLRLVTSSFEAFSFETYDLINAQWSLPFIQQLLFEKTFTEIKQALRPGSLLTGQFFGIHDTWNIQGTQMTFCTREQARQLLQHLQIITLDEVEKDGETASGQRKHWHVFHYIARNEDAW